MDTDFRIGILELRQDFRILLYRDQEIPSQFGVADSEIGNYPENKDPGYTSRTIYNH